MARKLVTVSVTFEIVMEVDADVWESAQRLDDGAQIARVLAAHSTTKIGEFTPDCAQVLNVEDANEV